MLFSGKFSGLGCFPLSSPHLLDSAGHGVAQPPATVLGNTHGPQDLQLVDQIGSRVDVFVLQLPFDDIPLVLNWITGSSQARL